MPVLVGMRRLLVVVAAATFASAVAAPSGAAACRWPTGHGKEARGDQAIVLNYHWSAVGG